MAKKQKHPWRVAAQSEIAESELAGVKARGRAAAGLNADCIAGDQAELSLGALEAIRATLQPCEDARSVRAALDAMPAEYVMGVHELVMTSIEAVLDD